jgi:hypothetical protein
MEHKNNTKHMPDRQPFRHFFPDFDYNLDNERSEDDENSFYCWSGTDHKETEKEKRE